MARVLALLAVMALGAAGIHAQSGNDLFQKALTKERVDGQPAEAIVLYERIVKDFVSDRPLAAKALLQMGHCYEWLGKNDAQKADERIVREFADQREPPTKRVRGCPRLPDRRARCATSSRGGSGPAPRSAQPSESRQTAADHVRGLENRRSGCAGSAADERGASQRPMAHGTSGLRRRRSRPTASRWPTAGSAARPAPIMNYAR